VWTKIGQCLEDSSSHCPFLYLKQTWCLFVWCLSVVTKTGQCLGRAGQGGQGRHPPTGPAGGPQQQPVDLWPHLDQSDGCVRGESAQRLGFGREAKKNSTVSCTHVRMHAWFPHPMFSLCTCTGTHPQILASGRISGRDQDLGISISSSSSLVLLRGFLMRSLRNKLL
jgi:hypothetical protein